MHLLSTEETDQSAAVVINWWTLWPVYVSALVSVAGAVTAFFAPKALERYKHRNNLEQLREQSRESNAQWQRDKKLDTCVAVMSIHAQGQQALQQAHHGSENPGVRLESEMKLDALLDQSRLLQSQLFLLGGLRIKILAKMFHHTLDMARNSIGTNGYRENYHRFQVVAHMLNNAMSSELGAETFGDEEDYDIERSSIMDEIYIEMKQRLRADSAEKDATTNEGK